MFLNSYSSVVQLELTDADVRPDAVHHTWGANVLSEESTITISHVSRWRRREEEKGEEEGGDEMKSTQRSIKALPPFFSWRSRQAQGRQQSRCWEQEQTVSCQELRVMTDGWVGTSIAILQSPPDLSAGLDFSFYSHSAKPPLWNPLVSLTTRQNKTVVTLSLQSSAPDLRVTEKTKGRSLCLEMRSHPQKQG